MPVVVLWVMERWLAWCGGALARGFKVRVLRWRSGGRALCCAVGAAGAAGGAIGDLGVLGALGALGWAR